MAVVRRYASHLRDAEGSVCCLVVCGAREEELPREDDNGVPVVRLDEALHEEWDIAIATWWTTADALFELHVRRRALFLQSLESRFYRLEERADRLGAMSVLDLPVDFIVVASHMEALLSRLRPDAGCTVVRNGVDKSVFRPAADGGDRSALRVLVEGEPALWFKGVADAVAAVQSMTEPATVTVVAQDVEKARESGVGADRVVGGLDPHGMAALYAQQDVLLKLSRFEGLALPVLEAFHVGVPCVVTPFTGSEEWARHGENCLVVGFDDVVGTGAVLDRVARDRGLLRGLRAGALETAKAWPDQEAASCAFAAAVRRVCDGSSGEPAPALRRMARTRRLWIETVREGQRRDGVRLEATRGEVRWYAQAYQQALETIDQLAKEREDLMHAHEVLRNRRAIRFADAVNRRLPWRRN